MPSPSELKEHGLTLYRAERYADAAEKFAEAARACEAAGDRGAAAELRNNQCVAHMAVSQWDAALAAVEGTPEMFRALGDRMREAQAVANLAAAHDGAGHVEQAAELYGQAIDLSSALTGRHYRSAGRKRPRRRAAVRGRSDVT